MTDLHTPKVYLRDMVVAPVPRLIAADRLSDGLVIQFENGQCAFYTSAFLFAKLSECQLLNEQETDW